MHKQLPVFDSPEVRAVQPGTDLSSYVRSLHRVYDQAFSGQRTSTPPRPVVARSWARMLELGLVPDGGNERVLLNAAELESRRDGSPMALVMPELRKVLGAIADASQFLLVVTDSDGVILWSEGATSVRAQAERLGFIAGMRWTEQVVGTNAIGTALAEAAPVQLFAAEHFEQTQHPWYCTAEPVHDPRSGELLGVVDVSGPALTLHPAIGALVNTAVRLATAQIESDFQARLDRLRRANAALTGVQSGAYLLVDEDGWVADAGGFTAPERIEAPRAGRAVAVPGLGLCTADPVDGGWLVHPNSAATPIVGRLDLTETPVLELRSDEAPWRIALTARHGELLGLIARASPGGLTASALSTSLYGDAAHQVSVRAEISRLRRTVGALITTNPYRLADGVHLHVID